LANIRREREEWPDVAEGKDPFDLGNLQLPDEVRVLGSMAAAKIERRRQHFVRVPNSWVEELRRARHISTYRVALHLLYRHWKKAGEVAPLSNVALAEVGVTRWEKWRALEELERLGLVEVRRRPRQAPLVKLILPL
jgi:hypothetical protein